MINVFKMCKIDWPETDWYEETDHMIQFNHKGKQNDYEQAAGTKMHKTMKKEWEFD